MNPFKISAPRFLWLVLCAAFLSQSAWAADGRIFGKVRGKPKIKVDPKSESAYSSRALRYATLFDYEKLKEVVVYAEPADASVTLSASISTAAVILHKTRRGLEFETEFQAVSRGAKVIFKNVSDEAVTLYSGGESVRRLTLNLEPMEEKTVEMGDIGFYRLLCLEEPDAQSRLFVAGPIFCTADAEGRYSLTVPAGNIKVTTWHYRLPPKTIDIEMTDSRKLELDVTLSVENIEVSE